MTVRLLASGMFAMLFIFAASPASRPAPIEWSGGDVSLGMGAVPA